MFGFPLDESCRIIMEAVKDALTDGVGVNEVKQNIIYHNHVINSL